MTDDTQRLLGEFGARLTALERTAEQTNESVHRVEEFISNVKGGWKVVLGLSAMVGAIAAFLLEKVFHVAAVTK